MSKALQDPILDGGIPFTAYFNGRLLSGEDLARDQQGNRFARRRIGQAIGDGVAFGLEIAEATGESTKSSPVLTVLPGVAINRNGQTLALGLNDRIAPYSDPMAVTKGDYGLADALRATGDLTDNDVPLGLLHWTAARGITFVDMWSIRRDVMSRGADSRWKWLSGECAR